jgi:phospholipid transport system transporter-binding protein
MNTVLRITGPLTLDRAAGQLGVLGDLASGGRVQLDFSAVAELDSAAVALLLHWQRQAMAAGCELEYVELPQSLRQLLAVYGLTDLLPAQ